MFDLKIVGGTVVDGTGAERYRADIGIKDGRIADVVRLPDQQGANDPEPGGLERAEAAETIDATGKVTTMKAVSGPTLLHQAAMDALRQWKYQPATLDGKAVAMHLTVTIQFRLQ